VTQRINLHDALLRSSFDHAIICTFTFQPQFFEGYCLDRFRCFAENKNITIIVDGSTYDALLQLPASEWPRLANIRYLLHRVVVAGTFHPKLFLFASKNKGLLVIGSANFTKPGLTNNAELVGLYRYERGKREQYVTLFRQALQFLAEISNRWPGKDLQSNLNDLTRDADWLLPETPEAACRLRLVHNLDRPLWHQIIEGLIPPLDALHVLSRYFDGDPDLLTRVRDETNPKHIVLWTQNSLILLCQS
jgi:hypothetical protein